MDASTLPTTATPEWAERFAASLHLHGDRVREFLAAQRQRLERAEAQLSEQLALVAGQLAQERDQTQQAKEEIERRSAQLTQQIESLEGLRQQFDARQAEWQQLQQRAAQQQEALAEQVRRQQDDLSRRFLEFADRQEQVDTAEANLRKQQRAFELVRAEHAAEAEQLAALRNRLEAERAAQAARAPAPPPAAAGAEPDGEDFRRRYEMALEDLRELKARNADLEQQLAKGRPAGAPPAPARSSVLNWETEKQRILAALEPDAHQDSDEQQAERLKIEEVIRQTDQLLAEKDREIAELKQLLQNQSGSFGALALGAAAVGEILDHDAIVQEERENLKRLQDECREKLRRAEIDISLERAKIARERSQIEDKLRLLESEAADASEKVEDQSKTGKPVRGRWLSRLGLKDLDEGKK